MPAIGPDTPKGKLIHPEKKNVPNNFRLSPQGKCIESVYERIICMRRDIAEEAGRASPESLLR